MSNGKALSSMIENQSEHGNEPPVTEKGKDHPLSILASDEGTRTDRKERAADVLTKQILSEFDVYRIRDDNNQEMWIYNDGVYVPNAQTYLKTYIERMLKRAYTDRFADRVIDRVSVRQDVVIDKEDFFNPLPERLCVENGILDLQSGDLEPHTPEEIHFQKIPVRYDPDAECPRVDEFFEDVVATDEDVQTLKEVFGFCLRKEYFLEKAVMLLGSGRNGKSKTLDLLRTFLGQDNCTNVELQDLDDDKKAINLHHAVANISGDISSRGIRNTAAFKQITGRDLMTVDRKYKTSVDFVNYAKQIFSANQLPETPDQSLAFFDRWILVEFPYEFVNEEKWERHSESERRENNYKKRNPDIIDDIVSDEELSGLLNEALEAYQRLVRRGRFTESDTAESTRIRWMRQADSLQAFMVQAPFETSVDRYVTKPDVKQAYKDYCERHDVSYERNPPVKSALQDEFNTTQGQKKIGDARPRVYYGIKFEDEYEQPSGKVDGLSRYKGSLETQSSGREENVDENESDGLMSHGEVSPVGYDEFVGAFPYNDTRPVTDVQEELGLGDERFDELLEKAKDRDVYEAKPGRVGRL